MKLEWMDPYREIVRNFYRSANGYSQICKTELFGEAIRFSPYEVQIMEHILEYADQHKNMKWYAEHLGLSQATYSKYVQRLVRKGLVEKYHAACNRKNIILMVSAAGLKEYEKYAEESKKERFGELFDLLGRLTPAELKAVDQVLAVWGRCHSENQEEKPDEPVVLVKVEPN